MRACACMLQCPSLRNSNSERRRCPKGLNRVWSLAVWGCFAHRALPEEVLVATSPAMLFFYLGYVACVSEQRNEHQGERENLNCLLQYSSITVASLFILCTRLLYRTVPVPSQIRSTDATSHFQGESESAEVYPAVTSTHHVLAHQNKRAFRGVPGI
jgi:hypothetical protein